MKAKIEIEIKKQKFKLETAEARELFDSLKEIFEPAPTLTWINGWPQSYTATEVSELKSN